MVAKQKSRESVCSLSQERIEALNQRLVSIKLYLGTSIYLQFQPCANTTLALYGQAARAISIG